MDENCGVVGILFIISSHDASGCWKSNFYINILSFCQYSVLVSASFSAFSSTILFISIYNHEVYTNPSSSPLVGHCSRSPNRNPRQACDHHLRSMGFCNDWNVHRLPRSLGRGRSHLWFSMHHRDL